MDDTTKQKINKIMFLAKERKVLLSELNSLDEYKSKIEKVKQKYVRSFKSKSRRTKTTPKRRKRTK